MIGLDIVKRKLNFIIIICLSLFLIFHFAIITISTGPLNPVSLKHQEFLNNYKNPFFYQSWNLFAPDPVTRTDRIAIKVKTKDGEDSDWFDISQPLLDRNADNSISPFNRAVRVPLGLVQNLYEEDEIIALYKEKKDAESPEDNDLVEFNDSNEEERSKKELELLYRFSFSMAQLAENPNNIAQVKIRLVQDHPVPFSKRNDKFFKKESIYVEFGWQDFQKVVSIK
jgi:hypothetical protein